MDKSNDYFAEVIELLNKIETEQYVIIHAAVKLQADTIENNRIIKGYGGDELTAKSWRNTASASRCCKIKECKVWTVNLFPI